MEEEKRKGNLVSCKKCWRTPCCCEGPKGCSLGIDEHGHIHGCNKCHSNPCHCHGNVVACAESLPSTIENFIKHFFGSIVRTEINGRVVWTLPCDLDVGLENNPRFPDEGLSCYFIRLFSQGLVGLTGPEGNPGAAGEDGANAYTVTLASFVQPTGAAPNSQVLTAFNPAIFAGLTVFIQTSGYHFINATDGNGTLFLTLIQAADGAPAVITAGKLVVAAGPQGSGPQGIQGPQGAPGPQGTAGESFTATQGMYHTISGTEENPGVVYSAVDFTSSVAEVNLPAQGTYELTAVVGLLGKATILDGDVTEIKLRDTTISTDVEAGEARQSNIEDQERTQVTIHCIYTTDSPNHNIQLQGKCTTSGAIGVMPLHTNITFVRIA